MSIGDGLAREVVRRYRLLTKPERKRARVLLVLSLSATVIEWLGGASVLAFVSLISQSGPLRVPALVAPAVDLFGTSEGARRIAAAVFMALFHTFRIVALIQLVRVRARIRGQIGHSLSGRLVDAHLAAPLSRHSRRNSAERIRDVTEHAPAVWYAVDAMMSMATESFVVLGLLGMLAVVRPVPVLVAGAALVLFVNVSLRLTRRLATAHAIRTRKVDAESLRALQQLYGAWREVKVLGREGYFRDEFVSNRLSALLLAIRSDTLAQIPRSVLEGAFVLGACVLAIFSGGSAGAFSVLGLYAYTGFRAVPATERILAHMALARWHIAMTSDIVIELEEFAPAMTEELVPFVFAREIKVEGVGYTHPDASAPALQDINLTIPYGTSLAIVGRTGAGKSTLLDLVLGLLAPDTGHVFVDGAELDARRIRSWRSHIGYVPQSSFMLDDTVRRNVAFGLPANEIDDQRVRRALEVAQAWRFVDGLPGGLDAVIGEHGARMSGGERQRLAIARALYREPEVLCLDEATAALDPATERELADATQGLAGRTLVIVTHRMTTARRCDRIAVLSRGRLAAFGSWDELLATSAEFRELAAEGVTHSVELPAPLIACAT